MLFRQLLPVFAALAIFMPFAIGGDVLDFVLRYLVAPVFVLVAGALVFSLFVAFLTPRR